MPKKSRGVDAAHRAPGRTPRREGVEGAPGEAAGQAPSRGTHCPPRGPRAARDVARAEPGAQGSGRRASTLLNRCVACGAPARAHRRASVVAHRRSRPSATHPHAGGPDPPADARHEPTPPTMPDALDAFTPFGVAAVCEGLFRPSDARAPAEFRSTDALDQPAQAAERVAAFTDGTDGRRCFGAKRGGASAAMTRRPRRMGRRAIKSAVCGAPLALDGLCFDRARAGLRSRRRELGRRPGPRRHGPLHPARRRRGAPRETLATPALRLPRPPLRAPRGLPRGPRGLVRTP